MSAEFIYILFGFVLRSSKNTIYKRLTFNPQPIQYIDSTSVSNDCFMKPFECVGYRETVVINCDERRRSIESDEA